MSPTITETNKKSTGGYVLKTGNSLPPGLDLDADTGAITGTPTTVNIQTRTIIVVTDAAGNTGEHPIIFPAVDAAPVSPPAATAPGVPQNFTATPGDGEVTLSWSAPTSNGGAAITKYRYIQKIGTGDYSDYADVPSSDGSTVTHTFTSLTNGDAYSFKICAYNSVGCGTETREQTATPRAPVPSDTTTAPIAGFALVNEASDGYINNSEKDSTETIFSPLTSTRAGVVVSYAQSTASSAGTDACSSLTFSYTLTAPPAINTLITDDTYYFCAKATINGIHTYGNKRTVVRDIVAPTGGILVLSLSDSSDTGVKGDDITNDTTPTIDLSFTNVSPNEDKKTALVTVYFTHRDNTGYSIETIGDSAITAPTLKEGTWTASVVSMSDAAGNQNSGFTVINSVFTIDTTDPSFSYTAPHSLTVASAISTMSPTITETNKKSTGGYVLKTGNSLPPGLDLDADTGAITGTPSTASPQTHTTTVVVTDAAGNVGEYTILFFAVRTAASPDTAAPRVSFSPTPNTTTTKGAPDIILTFNEGVIKVNGGAISADDIKNIVTLKGFFSPPVSFTGAITNNNGKTVITINPDANLPDDFYTITILANTIADVYGNRWRSRRSAVFTVDTTPPTATFSPKNGTTFSKIPTNIILSFNESVWGASAVEITNANAHTFVTLIKTGGDGTDFATHGTVAIDGSKTKITLTLPASLTDGVYTVSANTLEDEHGNGFSTAPTATFTVADTTPPPHMSPITLMNTGPFAGGDTYINAGEKDSTVKIIQTPTVTNEPSTANRVYKVMAHTASCTPDANTNSWSTAIPTINSVITDGMWKVCVIASGTQSRKKAGVSPTFIRDTAAPSFSYVPLTSLAVRTPISTLSPTLTETNPKDTGGYALQTGNTLPPGLSLHPDTGAITGIPETVNSQTHPTTIVVTDAAGNTGEHTITFPAVSDTPAPTVTFTPINNAIVSDNTINITLAFGEAVRKAGGSSITNGDIKNIVTLQNSKGIGVDFTGSISGNTITLNPTNNLSDDTYTITLVADTVEDLKSALVPEKSATFTVGATAPTVTFTPLDNGTVTNNNTINITLAFDEPVRKEDGTTITDSNAHTLVTLKKSGDDADLAVSGTTTFNTNTITINPSTNLADGTYTITLPANTVKDVHNNTLTIPQRATFTVDTAPPTVTFFPADKSTIFDNTTDITIRFNEAVRKINNNAITNSNAHTLVVFKKVENPETDPALAVAEITTFDSDTTPSPSTLRAISPTVCTL